MCCHLDDQNCKHSLMLKAQYLDILNVLTYTVFFPKWKSMITVKSLVTNVLQNFCVQQKTETHTGLEKLEGE